MTTIQFLLLFYYVFSVLFQIGFILADDDIFIHPLSAILAIFCAFIVAPFFFPMNLGIIIKRMK